MLPGVDEVLALLAVRELAVAGDWDALVVDCAPTAETLRLLALPEALTWYLQKVFPAQRRMAQGIRPLADDARARRRHPAGQPLRGAAAAQRRPGRRCAQLLGDPAITSVRLVLTPEAVVAAEARRTFTALALYGYAVDLVVANRVFPAGDDEWRPGWARAQQAQLAAIRESFAGLPVRELPYRAAEPVGADALREVADALYGELPDPAARRRARSELLRVDADGDDFVLRHGAAARRRRRRSTSPGPATTWCHRRRAPPGAHPAERAAPLRRRGRRVRRRRSCAVRFRPDPAPVADAATGATGVAERATHPQPPLGRRGRAGWSARCRTGRGRPSRPAADGHGGPECQWCPLCQFMAVLRGERPELTERVAEAGTALASAVGARARRRGRPAPPGRHATPTAPPRVQRIDLGRARTNDRRSDASRSASTSAARRSRPASSTRTAA